MATNEEVEAIIADVHGKLLAAEAVHSGPEMTALHASLGAALAAVVDHFGLDEGVSARSGGNKPPVEP